MTLEFGAAGAVEVPLCSACLVAITTASRLSADAAPGFAATTHRSPNNAPPNTKGHLSMSTSPTETGTTTGSNPTGVASPNHDNDAASSDRTELRSVPSAGESQITRRPGVGDLVEVYSGISPGGPRWRLGTVWAVHPERTDPAFDVSFAGVKALGYAYPFAAENGTWRWPAAEEKPEVLSLEEASGPEVRRCTVKVTESTFADECGAVIGAGLVCDVCQGHRCFSHCGGLDHFGGKEFARGGSGALTWKIAEVAANRFQGQLYKADGGVVTIVANVGSGSPNEVLDFLEEEVSRQNASAAGVIEKPATITSAAAEAVRAGRGTREQRERVLAEVIAWCRESEAEWNELGGGLTHDDQDVVAMCKALHDRLTVELFARIGGAL
jgi:hypothetical protein